MTPRPKFLTKDDAKAFDAELTKVLQEFATKHGVQLKPSGGSYTSNSFSKRIEFTQLGEDGKVEVSSVEVQKANWRAVSIGIKLPAGKNITDATVQIAGKGVCSILGLQARARDNHWIVQDTKGSKYRVDDTLTKACHKF